ncbi:MAG: hypothetical protein LBT40_14650 [Deltaproteobacteria bacterium]|jgi:hypothetical protein|nr:hypothetical protein [Deltaproteobacteria bacterium]
MKESGRCIRPEDPPFSTSIPPGPWRWPVFDSIATLSSLAPSFTMRFHPDFRQGKGPRKFPPSFGELVERFSFSSPETGRSATFDINRLRLMPCQLSALRRDHDKFLAAFGNGVAQRLGGNFDGDRTFEARGFQAGDMYISGVKNTSTGWLDSMFGVMRSFIVGDAHFLFSLFCYLPSSESRESSCTSRRNPVFLEYGEPALDSVAFEL